MAKTALGLDRNIVALLAYVLGWVSGLIVILIEKEDEFVRFHAMQSIVTFGALTILSIAFGTMFMFMGIMRSLINIAGMDDPGFADGPGFMDIPDVGGMDFAEPMIDPGFGFARGFDEFAIHIESLYSIIPRAYHVVGSKDLNRCVTATDVGEVGTAIGLPYSIVQLPVLDVERNTVAATS